MRHFIALCSMAAVLPVLLLAVSIPEWERKPQRKGLIKLVVNDFPELTLYLREYPPVLHYVHLYCDVPVPERVREIYDEFSKKVESREGNITINLLNDTKCSHDRINNITVVVDTWSIGPNGMHDRELYVDIVNVLVLKKLHVYDFVGREAGDKVIVKWKVKLEKLFPNREFHLRRKWVYNNQEIAIETLKAYSKNKTCEWEIQQRPGKYIVTIVPITRDDEKDKLEVDPKEQTIEVNVKEVVPKHAPTDVEVFQEGDNVLVDFEPLPLSKIPGHDAGCEVRVCEKPDVITSCDVRNVPPRTPTAEFRSLQPHTTYHVAVACKTGAGMGPLSPWLTFTTGKLETKKPRTTTTTVTTTTTAPKPVSGVDVSIEVLKGMKVILVVEFKMKDGSRFRDESVRSLEIFEHRKSKSGAFPEVELISNDPTVRQINLGLSPGFKFDTRCFSYAVNVTFQNNANEFVKTKETCYSFTSPGFMIVYAALVVLAALIVTCYAINAKNKKLAKQQRRMGMDDTKTEGSRMGTVTGPRRPRRPMGSRL